MVKLPRLYAILDVQNFPGADEYVAAAEEFVVGGVRLLQYRNKMGNARQILDQATALKRVVGDSVKLIMNDRADLALAAGFDGVHLGQDDLSAEDARRVAGDGVWVGISTHNGEQVAAADRSSADYVAIGPVFATSSKVNSDPVIGVEGVRMARLLTCKPLVVIGGITRANCRAVMDAGADSVAVISDLVLEPRKSVEEFLRILG